MLDLSTDKVLDKICDLIPYIDNLKDNDEFVKFFDRDIHKEENENEIEFKVRVMREGFGKITKLIPSLLKNNREDIYGIISVVNDKNIEEIKTQKITITIKEIKDIFEAEEIKELFL